MKRERMMGAITALAITLTVGVSASLGAVTFDMANVRDPNNPSYAATGWGTVTQVFRIAKHEVTNRQYAEFLNAIAATDTKALYNTSMPGISRSGSSGSYTYSVVSGQENKPVCYIDWYDAIRFCNWMHNGQPSGAQGVTTTEDGAYTLSLGGATGQFIYRRSGATYYLPTNNEWHKAAYYDPTLNSGAGGYNLYATHITTAPTATTPNTSTKNSANWNNAVGALTSAGAYQLATSHYGLYDTMGNVEEWLGGTTGYGTGGIRGGNFKQSLRLAASAAPAAVGPTLTGDSYGFRVAAPAGQPLGTVLVVQ